MLISPSCARRMAKAFAMTLTSSAETRIRCAAAVARMYADSLSARAPRPLVRELPVSPFDSQHFFCRCPPWKRIQWASWTRRCLRRWLDLRAMRIRSRLCERQLLQPVHVGQSRVARFHLARHLRQLDQDHRQQHNVDGHGGDDACVHVGSHGAGTMMRRFRSSCSSAFAPSRQLKPNSVPHVVTMSLYLFGSNYR